MFFRNKQTRYLFRQPPLVLADPTHHSAAAQPS